MFYHLCCLHVLMVCLVRFRDLPAAKVMAGCELVVENACRAAASCVLKRAQGDMREHLLALHKVAASATAAPASASAAPSAPPDISHKSTVTDCARSLESTIRGAMKELQVLATTSTPILQRFARFFTDILHESCRAIIVNTAVGPFSVLINLCCSRVKHCALGLFPDTVIAPLAVVSSLPLMSTAELTVPPAFLEPRR